MEKLNLIKFYTDTETTGLDHLYDQILSYSAIIEDSKGKNIEEYEKTVKLKNNILPDPKSLIINNINPFSKDYISNAFKEIDLQADLMRIANKAYKCIFIAYNANFDINMYHALFSRLGYNFNRYFPVIWDPLVDAKKLVEKGIIITPEIIRGTKSYRTSKLEEVFKALGNDSSTFNAHSALDDTRMLQTVAHGVFFLATQRELSKINPIPHTYQENEIYAIVYNDEEQGLITKYVKIIQNINKNSCLYVLNSEEQTEIIDYHRIFDQYEFEGKLAEQLLLVDIDPLKQDEENIIIKRHTKHYINHINEIKNHAKHIFEIKDDLEQLKLYIKNLDLKTIKEIEDYSFSEYNEFVLEKIYGLEYKIKIDKIQLSNKIFVEADPVGIFRLINEDKIVLETVKKTEIDKLAKELLEIELSEDDKKYVFKFVDTVVNEGYVKDDIFILEKHTDKENKFFIRDIRQSSRIIEEDYDKDKLEERMIWWYSKVREDRIKTLIKKIPSLKNFEISKHPKHLLDEYNEVKVEVFQTSNKLQKEILKDLLDYYKTKYPSIFKDVTLPNFQLNLASFLKK